MLNLRELGGGSLTESDVSVLEDSLGLRIPAGVVRELLAYPLAGLALVLDETADHSGLGAEIRWMTVEEIIDEAKNAYPGIVAIRFGYMPVGMCLEGSGDPYFIRLKDGALVRIPHDAVEGRELCLSRVELVASSLRELVTGANAPNSF